eukprot:11232887-Alexandrium_andersonii.AAC.1
MQTAREKCHKACFDGGGERSAHNVCGLKDCPPPPACVPDIAYSTAGARWPAVGAGGGCLLYTSPSPRD